MNRRLWVVSGGVSALAGCIVAGAAIGGWLDGRFGYAPWGLTAGVVAGTCAGLWELWRIVARGGDNGE